MTLQNAIYDLLLSGLAPNFGSAEHLESGNGVRFKSSRKGAITIYHSGIAAGNAAEIAFEPSSVSRRLGVTEREFRALVAAMRTFTKRDVDPNPQYNWPRVGISNEEHARHVLSVIASHLGIGE